MSHDGAMTETAPTPLRRNPDYVRLTGGQVVEAVGSGMTGMALLLLTFELTGSSAQAGLVSAAYGVGHLAAGLPAGALVDRWDRRRTLVVTGLLLAVVMATVPIAGALGTITFGHLLAVALVEGCLASFIWPAGRAAIKTIVPPEQLGTAATVTQARMSVGSLVGPALSGALFAVGHVVPLVTNAVLYALAALGYRSVRTPLPAPARTPDASSGLVREIGEGLAWVWRTAPIRDMVAVGMVLNLAANGIFTVAILALQRDGLPPQGLGLLESALGASALVGALLAGLLLRRLRVGTVTIAVIWSMVVLLALMPLSPSVWWVGALGCAVSLALPAVNAGMGAFSLHVTPDGMQGRAGSASGFVSSAMMPLGIGAAGFLLEHWGRTPALLTYTGLLAVAGVLVSASRHIRTIPRTEDFARLPQASSVPS